MSFYQTAQYCGIWWVCSLLMRPLCLMRDLLYHGTTKLYIMRPQKSGASILINLIIWWDERSNAECQNAFHSRSPTKWIELNKGYAILLGANKCTDSGNKEGLFNRILSPVRWKFPSQKYVKSNQMQTLQLEDIVWNGQRRSISTKSRSTSVLLAHVHIHTWQSQWRYVLQLSLYTI